jgi:hypothetical protein
MNTFSITKSSRALLITTQDPAQNGVTVKLHDINLSSMRTDTELGGTCNISGSLFCNHPNSLFFGDYIPYK